MEPEEQNDEPEQINLPEQGGGAIVASEPQNPPPTLMVLPNELLLYIIQHFTHPPRMELVNLALVCRRFYNLITNWAAPQLHYAIGNSAVLASGDVQALQHYNSVSGQPPSHNLHALAIDALAANNDAMYNNVLNRLNKLDPGNIVEHKWMILRLAFNSMPRQFIRNLLTRQDYLQMMQDANNPNLDDRKLEIIKIVIRRNRRNVIRYILETPILGFGGVFFVESTGLILISFYRQHLKMCEYLCNRAGVVLNHFLYDNRNIVIKYACQFNKHNLITYLIDNCNVTIENVRLASAVAVATDNNHVEILRFLRAIGFDGRAFVENANYMIIHSCENGFMEILKFAHEELELPINYFHYNCNLVLRRACINNQLEVIRYLIDVVGLTRDDIEETLQKFWRLFLDTRNFTILTNLLENVFPDFLSGDINRPIPFVLWALLKRKQVYSDLCRKYNINLRLVIRQNKEILIQKSAEDGNVNLLRYMHTSCGITLQDIIACRTEEIAVMNNRVSVLKFMHSIGLGKDDVSKIHLVRTGCRIGDLDMIKFACEDLGFTADDFRPNNNYALGIASVYGQFAVVDYLRGVVGLNRADFVDAFKSIIKQFSHKLDYILELHNLPFAEIFNSDRMQYILFAFYEQKISACETLCRRANLDTHQVIKQNKNTAIGEASATGKVWILEYLRDNCNLLPGDLKDAGALMLAVQNNHLSVLQFMRSFGTPPSEFRGNNDEALRIARDRGFHEIVAFLQSIPDN